MGRFSIWHQPDHVQSLLALKTAGLDKKVLWQTAMLSTDKQKALQIVLKEHLPHQFTPGAIQHACNLRWHWLLHALSSGTQLLGGTRQITLYERAFVVISFMPQWSGRSQSASSWGHPKKELTSAMGPGLANCSCLGCCTQAQVAVACTC